jgi:hypothetical protein
MRLSKVIQDFDTNNLVRVAQPFYGPDLAPSDFLLCEHQKSSFIGCTSKEPNELLEAVTAILNEVPRENRMPLFWNGLQK